MRQILFLIILSGSSYFLLSYYKGHSFLAKSISDKSLKNDSFCEQLKTNDINFKTFISEIFDADSPKINVYENINKINCYIKYLIKNRGYNDTLILLDKLLSLTDKNNQDFIIKKVQEVLDSKNIEELYTVVSIFYKKYKMYPRDLNQLVELGLLDSIPKEPYGSQYYIDSFGKIKRVK